MDNQDSQKINYSKGVPIGPNRSLLIGLFILLFVFPFVFIYLNNSFRNSLTSNLAEYEAFSFLKEEKVVVPEPTNIPVDKLCSVSEREIESLVYQFQLAQQSRDPKVVLDYFTAAINTEDKNSYAFLLSQDTSDSTPRLYSDSRFNYILESYEIKKDPSKVDSLSCILTLIETRQYPESGSSEEVEIEMIVKKNNNKWSIDKYYYFRKSNIDSLKYSAFYL